MVYSKRPLLFADWTTLEQNNHCNFDILYLELWKLVKKGQPRPHNFGTREYFSAYERCNSLEPEHFIYHSSQSYLSNNKTSGSYLHIVEDQYMLRLCPCGGRIRHKRTHQRVCDCQRNELLMVAHCSPIIKVSLSKNTRNPKKKKNSKKFLG